MGTKMMDRRNFSLLNFCTIINIICKSTLRMLYLSTIKATYVVSQLRGGKIYSK